MDESITEIKAVEILTKRKPGRPKGAKNKPKAVTNETTGTP
jgi:hypothetical protein